MKIGDIVIYTTKEEIKLPAIVVNVSDVENRIVDLQVFTNCLNSMSKANSYDERMKPTLWKTSILFDKDGKTETWNYLDVPQSTIKAKKEIKDDSKD
ncbi:MAG: hypothetical protein RLZZ577_104 [Bacteroidota bacterium]